MSVESRRHSECLNSSTDSTASSSSGLEVLSKVCAAAMAVEQNNSMDTTEPMDTSSGSNNSSIRRSPSFKERIHPKFRKNSTPGTT